MSALGQHRIIRGMAAHSLAAALLVGATVSSVIVVPPASAATPPAPVAPTRVWVESFENFPQPDSGPSGATPMALNFTGQGTYVGTGGTTYTGASGWLNVSWCNGIVVPGAWTPTGWPTSGASPCPVGAMNPLVSITRALGTLNGLGNGNHAVAAFTGFVNPGAGVMAQTVAPVTLSPTVPGGHYLSMSVNAGAVNCGVSGGAGDPVLNFDYSTDGGSNWIPLGGDVRVCTLATIGSGIKGGTVFSNAGSKQPVSASNLLVRVRNQTGIVTGNDMGWDDLSIYDATPTLSKAFSPMAVDPGGVSTLTFTITNTTEKGEKDNWSFTDVLPSGLTIDSTPGVQTTCAAATVTATAASDTVTVTAGKIATGASNCTISVRVKVPDPAELTYLNDLLNSANLTAVSGLIPSGSATLSTPYIPELTKEFSPDSITTGGVSTLTFTVSNVIGLNSRNFSFAEALPAGLSVAPTSNAVTTCLAATVDAPAGGSTIAVTSGTVAAGVACTVRVDVTGNGAGSYVNSLEEGGNLTSSTGLAPAGTATLTISTPPPPPIPQYTLTYDGNGGTCTAPPQTGPSGTWVNTYDASACTRLGYVFTGWNTAPGGTGTALAPGSATQLSGDNTLYAQWSPIPISAVDDATSTKPGTAVTGSVATNDAVPAGSTYAKTSGPTSGTVTINPDGTYTYVPATGFVGVDSFTYTVCAPGGIPCATAMVTIAVGEAVDDKKSTSENVPVTGSAATNDKVPAGSAYTVKTPPTNGTVVMQSNGTYTYTPAPGFVGIDEFTYQVCPSGSSVCFTATITITVKPEAKPSGGSGPSTAESTPPKPGEKPVEAGSVKPVVFAAQVPGTASAIRIAPVGTSSWVRRVAQPGVGVWQVRGTRVVFTPNRRFTGVASVRYQATQADGRIAYGRFTARATVVPGTINGGRSGGSRR